MGVFGHAITNNKESRSTQAAHAIALEAKPNKIAPFSAGAKQYNTNLRPFTIRFWVVPPPPPPPLGTPSLPAFPGGLRQPFSKRALCAKLPSIMEGRATLGSPLRALATVAATVVFILLCITKPAPGQEFVPSPKEFARPVIRGPASASPTRASPELASASPTRASPQLALTSPTRAFPEPAPPRPTPRLFLVIRTYWGGAGQAVWRALHAFVDWRTTHVTVVLDAESAADHAFGEKLLVRYAGKPFAVRYAELPSNGELDFKPFWVNGGKFNTTGYTRQLWDTFWLDTWLPRDAGPDDLLGILDTDAQLSGLLVPRAYLDSNGRIFQPALQGDHFDGDQHLLGEPAPYDAMWTDTMPQIYYVSTFPRLRAFLGGTVNGSLRDAWLGVGARYHGQLRRISPANVIFNYAVHHEAHLYGVSLTGPSGGPVVPIFGSNRAPKWAPRRGCCRLFRFPNCSASEIDDADHLTYVNNAEQWLEVDRRRVVDSTYAHMLAARATLPPEDLRERIRGCFEMTVPLWNNTWLDPGFNIPPVIA
jgi:hypothetical protein